MNPALVAQILTFLLPILKNIGARRRDQFLTADTEQQIKLLRKWSLPVPALRAALVNEKLAEAAREKAVEILSAQKETESETRARTNGNAEVGFYVVVPRSGQPYQERRFVVRSKYEDKPDWPESSRRALAFARKHPENFIYSVDCSGKVEPTDPAKMEALASMHDDDIEHVRQNN